MKEIREGQEEVWWLGTKARRYVDRVMQKGVGEGDGLAWEETREPLTEAERAWLNRLPEKQEVVKQLKKARKGKSGGTDGVCEWLLAKSGEWMQTEVVKMVQEAWTWTEVESKEKRGQVVLLAKPGRRAEDLNKGWRRVTMGGLLNKLVYRVMEARLRTLAEKKGWWSGTQYGGRKGRGVSEAVAHLQAEIVRVVQSGLRRVASVGKMDIGGAFDEVPWEGLKKMMRELGWGEETMTRYWAWQEDAKVKAWVAGGWTRGWKQQRGIR